MIGRTLQHYEIVEHLGAGGMGEVYLARDTKLGRDVAVKMLPDGLADDTERLGRLRREAKLLAALNHPNIATIHDLVEAEGTVFLVLEYLDGRPLDSRLIRGPLQVDEAIDSGRQVAEALEAAHDKGIIHRDLKPSNVMLLSRGRVKVLDFGIGKSLALDDSIVETMDGTASLDQTATGGLVGTAPYISPEQIHGREVDRRADIWAFGCLLYEMLAGRRAFHRETVADTLAAIVEAEPDWSRLPAETPGPVARMLKRTLRKDPEQRARDMWHLRLELGDALEDAEETTELVCAECGHGNRLGNRFCSGCGTELRRQCEECGAQVDHGALFCSSCGAALPSAETKSEGAPTTAEPSSTVGETPGGSRDAVKRTPAPAREGDAGVGSSTVEEPAEDAPPRDDAGRDDTDTGLVDTETDPILDGERRQVTVLCSALVGYDDLLESVGPDEADRVVARLRERLDEVAERHEGLVNRFSGDDIVVLFGVPVAHERDALRAVRAAFELHRLADDLADQLADGFTGRLGLRTALDSGSVLCQEVGGSEPYRLSGEPMQVAGALRGQARDDEILLSPRCARLIGPHVETEPREEVSLRGREMRPHVAVEEKEVGSRVDAGADERLTPYAGRQRELEQLVESVEAATAGEGRLVTVVGDAGAGKSRLLHEFRGVCRQAEADGDGGVAILQGRCRTYGEGVPYLPFLEALRDCLGLDATSGNAAATVVEKVRAIDADLEGFLPFYLEFLSTPSDDHPMPKRTEGDDFRVALQEALAALFTMAARRRPLVMLLEDWHWADESSEALLLQIAGMVSAHPLLLVVTYRPERSFDWGPATTPLAIRLGPLEQKASAAIIRSVLEVDEVAGELVEVLHERTGGNPFFLEEICRTLEEEGSLQVRDDRAAAAAPEELQLPDTIQAVIRTRLDRIDRRARDLLRVASVVGREFSRSLLERTVAIDGDEIGPILEQLQGLGMVQQVRVLPEPTYRFNHALTQEVTYESLLQHQRRHLHGLVGEAIEDLYPERLDEQLDTLARHFSHAEEWDKAVHYGMRAAEHYTNLSQFPEARRVLEETERWLSRLPESEEKKEQLVELLLRRERIGEHLGEIHLQEASVEGLLELLEPEGESPELAEARLREGELRTLQGRHDEAEEALRESLRVSRTLCDEVAERRALRSMGFMYWQQDRHEEARDFTERALEIGRRQDDPEAMVTDLANLASVLRSAGELERAKAYSDESLGVAEQIPTSMARTSALWIAAGVYFDLGEEERAIEWLQEAHEVARQQRFPHHQHLQMIALANLYWNQGRIDEGIEHFQQAVTISRRFNAAHGLSESLRALGEAFLTLRRTDEAVPYLEESAELFARSGDQESEAAIRANLATAHEQVGDHQAAATAWEDVLRLRRALDDRAGQVEALEGIGRALRETDPDVARSHLTKALEVARELDDRPRQASLYNSLGILEWGRERFGEALDHYERALELLDRAAGGDPQQRGLILNSLGVVLGELDRTAEAVDTLEDARKLNRESGAALLEAHSLAALADLALEDGRAEEAVDLYENALSLRRRIRDRQGEGWMLLSLSRAQRAAGKESGADDNLDDARRIAREVGDVDLERACAAARGEPEGP